MPSFNTINFENHKIIVIIDNNNIIWFNAKQVYTSLGYKQAKKLYQRSSLFTINT